MMLALTIAGWTAFAIAILVGIALDMLGLFGNWIILGAVAIAAALTGFAHFGGWTLAILFGLAVLGEILETLAAGAGAARFGGGKGAITAALIGCILGAIAGTPLFPILGTIFGACVGAFAGAAISEFLMREKTVRESLYVGTGAALGKIGGMVLKTATGFAMLFVAWWGY